MATLGDLITSTDETRESRMSETREELSMEMALHLPRTRTVEPEHREIRIECDNEGSIVRGWAGESKCSYDGRLAHAQSMRQRRRWAGNDVRRSICSRQALFVPASLCAFPPVSASYLVRHPSWTMLNAVVPEQWRTSVARGSYASSPICPHGVGRT